MAPPKKVIARKVIKKAPSPPAKVIKRSPALPKRAGSASTDTVGGERRAVKAEGVRARSFTSIGDLKRSVKGGDQTYLAYIKPGTMTVRFITEPDGWVEYFEHWIDNPDGSGTGGRSEPCRGPGCEYCADGIRLSKRILANAWVQDDERVRPVAMPPSLSDSLLEFYDKYETIMDRDYDLQRTGSGKTGTRYKAIPDSPSRRRLGDAKPFDLIEVAEQQARPVVDEDDDVVDDIQAELDAEEARQMAKAKARRTVGGTKSLPRKTIIKRK